VLTGSDLAIVVPLWRRTENLDRLLASVWATVPDAEVVCVVSPDDAPVLAWCNEPHDSIRGWVHPILAQWPGGSPGDYSRKINTGYRASFLRPFIFTGADDIEFQPGWYEAARDLVVDEEESATHDLPMIGVVGTVDDCNPRTFDGSHSTHSLVARWYADLGGCVDQSGVIYHEGYAHEYCDDELVQTAKMRLTYAHAFDAHVTHHHPMAGRAEDDDTYRTGRSRTPQSRALYRARRRLWGEADAQPGVAQVRR
jgi:hypothetical protein